MKISGNAAFLIGFVAVLGVLAFSGRGTMPVAEAASGFSTAAAAQSFVETGDMSLGTDFVGVAVTTMKTREHFRQSRTSGCSVGCSVGCSSGCSFGCSSGCSFGCRP